MAFVTHLLASIFGTGGWIAINSIWLELPLVVKYTPEGWHLPSYVTVIIQLANIGPLIVTIMYKAKPGWVKEVVAIYTLLVLGIVSMFLLAFFWREANWIAGQTHSTAFLILTFLLSVVGCTSSVAFLPFMRQLQPKYISTLFFGVGLSNLLPAILSLIQGVGMVKCVNVTQSENTTQPWPNATHGGYHLEAEYLPTNFSIQVFFFLVSILMVFCLVAFFFLTRLSQEDGSNVSLLQGSVPLSSYSTTDEKISCNSEPSDTCKRPEDVNPGSGNSSDLDTKKVTYSWGHYTLMYLLAGLANALANGVIQSVNTFFSMPYGDLAYHLSAVLSSMASPLAGLAVMFLPSRSLTILVLLSVLGTGFAAYNMVAAVMSPCPILHNSTWGEVLIVTSTALFNGTFGYVKFMIGVILRSQSHSALVWWGAVMQLGSLIGALVMFPLVNVYGFFISADLCNRNCPG